MINEKVSAYLDGECDDREAADVAEALMRDPAQRAAWQRQLWLRSALRSERDVPPLDPGFADRVAAAIDSDATAPAGKVVPMRSRRRRTWRSAAGLAAAASVAAVAVLISQPVTNVDIPNVAAPVMSADVTESNPVADVTQVAANEPRDNRRERDADHWSVSDPAVADQLHGYLIEHNGVSRGYGLSSATPSFLRVATYGQSEGR
ncbi:sigma-E factor negative regulatory protein [Salinisphaera sp. P385]|uniref:Sigma-E factor negative regulatory protein n=1 Tax=Spectribacter acetivorans TaxID=3075603 RepID=A0ABU3B3Q2_9GAMM|nr:sigma-E factor negative regulatory protein [Salinisphaera sp. P385]MDT0616859.1 sigma-E factor negative regulatory protein [Salinisphaera sp. P385]